MAVKRSSRRGGSRSSRRAGPWSPSRRSRAAGRTGPVLKGWKDYDFETEMEIGRKSYTLEGAMRVYEVPRDLPPGEEPSGPEDLYEQKWEPVIKNVTETISHRPYWRKVPLAAFMRSYGALARVHFESAYMAAAEAQRERMEENRRYR